MPSRAHHAERGTIKEFACEYFTRVNYVDIYGREVGFEYDFILAEIKRHFPKAKTSKRWLRMMAYELNGTTRMPARIRSRRILAEGYAMVLLLRRSGRRSVYMTVTRDVKLKFPDQHVPASRLRSLEVRLRNLKFTVPPRQ